MNCKVKYIEDEYRKEHPYLADRLTTIHNSVWKAVKESKLFREYGTGPNATYLFSKTGTDQHTKQLDLIKSINEKYKTPAGKSIIQSKLTKAGNNASVQVVVHPLAQQEYNNLNPPTLFQKPGVPSETSKASPETIALVKNLLTTLGVDIKQVKDIYTNGVKQNSSGIARVTQKLIEVVEGAEAKALGEEGMHFVVSIIKQTNPELYKQLLKEINGYDMLNKVFADYGTDSNYQIDGKPNVLKLKEEAIAKVLIEKIINEKEGSTEKPENLAKVETWWDKIINFIKGLFAKSGFDKLKMDILKGKDIGTAEDIREEEGTTYDQKKTGDPQTDTFDLLREEESKITPPDNEKKTPYGYNNENVGLRVSDLVSDYYDNVFRNSKSGTQDEFDDAKNSVYSETGTLFHADIHHMMKNVFTDESGYVRAIEGDDSNYVSRMDDAGRTAYNLFKDNLRERIKSLNEGGKTRFLSEVMVINPKYGKSGLAGTIDFMAIKSNGMITILDWKFMGLNTAKYTDIPWYKIGAWNEQMDIYRHILEKAYGINASRFEQTMMVPVRVEYSAFSKAKNILPKLLSIEIGDVDIKKITKDYLIPVGVESQTTGSERIDNLLRAFNADYKALADKPALGYEAKADKAEQMNDLFRAIRKLQMQQDIKPLLKQAETLVYYTKQTIAKYNEEWKDADPFEYTDKDMTDFSHDLRNHEISLTPYLTLNIALRELFKGEEELTEEQKNLKSKLRDIVDAAGIAMDDLRKANREFGEKILAKREGIDDLSKPDKVVKGFSRIFLSTALIQTTGMQTYYKKYDRLLTHTAQDAVDHAHYLLDLQHEYGEWAKNKGLTRQNYFDILKKKGKNELIDEYNSLFYKELKDKIEDGDIEWIRNNVDVEATKLELKEKLDKEVDRIKNRAAATDMSDEELEKKLEIEYRKYDSGEKGQGWLQYTQVKRNPLRSEWESVQFKELSKPENEVAKKLYDYIIERNNFFSSIGYLSKEEAARTFLPWMKAGIMEVLASGGDLKLAESLLNGIAVDSDEIGFANYDPRHGGVINKIPIYYTKEIKGEAVSEDLFKNMMLYNAAGIRFKYMQDLEGQALLLSDIEKNKGSINTSWFGRSRFKNGKLDINYNDNSKNSELFDNMITVTLYSQKYLADKNFDILLGSFGEWGKNVNKALGINIFPEGQVSLNRTVNSLNNYFRGKTLGLSFLSPLSNLLGGSFQSLINSERYFNRIDYSYAHATVAGKLFGMNFKNKEKFIKALDYFLPLSENYSRDYARKLSINKLDGDKINHFMMGLMTGSEKFVQTTNFLAFIKNTIVIDGVLHNTREYVKTLPEYENMFAGSQADQIAKKKAFEKEVERLNKEHGVLNVAEVVDNKLVIPGVNRKSDTVVKIRAKIQQINSDALGTLPESQKRMLNAQLFSDSISMFKGWIPRLVDVRFGDLKYNSASDAHEFGRMRTLANEVTKRTFYSLDNLKALFSGTTSESGFNRMREDYEKKKADYEKQTGKEFKMTEAEYMDLYNKNLRGSIFDMLASLTFLSIFLGLKANMPDKDEDVQIRNSYKFMLKAADKFRDELTYFYDPSSISGLLSTGIFPTFKLATDFEKLLANFMKYNWGLIKGESNEDMKNIHFIKYLMEELPGTNQIQTYLPMTLPNLAKYIGVQQQSQAGFSR